MVRWTIIRGSLQTPLQYSCICHDYLTIKFIYILIYRSMLQWKAWHSDNLRRHSVSHFYTHTSKSLKDQFVTCRQYFPFSKSAWNWALWICLILISVKEISHSLTKPSKGSPMHLLWFMTWNLLSLYFHFLQKAFFPGSIFTITFLPSAQPSQFPCQHCMWYYCIKQKWTGII